MRRNNEPSASDSGGKKLDIWVASEEHLGMVYKGAVTPWYTYRSLS